jgi:polygalacturonase
MSGGVRNLFAVDNHAIHEVANLVFLKSSRRRGGFIENIHIHGFRAEKVRGEVLAIIPNYDGDTTSPHVPRIEGVHLSDIEVGSAGKGIRIHGWPEEPIRTITLTRVRAASGSSEASALAVEVSGAEDVRLTEVTLAGRTWNQSMTVPAAAAPPRRN